MDKEDDMNDELNLASQDLELNPPHSMQPIQPNNSPLLSTAFPTFNAQNFATAEQFAKSFGLLQGYSFMPKLPLMRLNPRQNLQNQQQFTDMNQYIDPNLGNSNQLFNNYMNFDNVNFNEVNAENNQENFNLEPTNFKETNANGLKYDEKSSKIEDEVSDSKEKKEKKIKKKKVPIACIYCHRSHMTCDLERPCKRCVIRNIGHLCQDREIKKANYHKGNSRSLGPSMNNSPGNSNTALGSPNLAAPNTTPKPQPLPLPTLPIAFASEYMDSEYKVISDFMKNIQTSHDESHFLPRNRTESFLLTAADPSDGTSQERLKQFFDAKYQAGLLKPYDYVNGYSRLQRYMDTNMSPMSRQRILNVISTFRPTFHAIARSLTDIDLLLVEEGFERLLLDYDRVFSAMGVPACLWRRTGEVFRGNKEFAHLIGIPFDQLKEGRVCIYELMTEDSAVSYWDKYGNIAFDPSQKAMLSSCSLKNRRSQTDLHPIATCFSFTIRRDKYNIPIAIVGNFLPIHPTTTTTGYSS